MANKIETSSKNIKPRINLNHNIPVYVWNYNTLYTEEFNKHFLWSLICDQMCKIINCEIYNFIWKNSPLMKKKIFWLVSFHFHLDWSNEDPTKSRKKLKKKKTMQWMGPSNYKDQECQWFGHDSSRVITMNTIIFLMALE